MLLAIKTVKTLLNQNFFIKGITQPSWIVFQSIGSFQIISDLDDQWMVWAYQDPILNISDLLLPQHRLLVAIWLV